MKIKRMTAVFGKLDRASLELGPGLNLIYAPNEGGKSTWAAFWRSMLYGIDTRDRDRKGYLADKNRWQPWSGAPMEGELLLEWEGKEITLRRGPRGTVPFGSFSAVYTGTEEPVPGLTAATCGETLTGVGRPVFERSAFLGGDLAVTPAPELERRIAALVSSGEEDVSFSLVEGRLRDWLNRRKVNRSVGLIPKLEEELRQAEDALDGLEELSGRISELEAQCADLEREKNELEFERHVHRRLAQRELNARYAQAGRELEEAEAELAGLEEEAAKYGPLPSSEDLRRAQGDLQYIKVLEDDVRQGEAALKEAEDATARAKDAAGEGPFAALTGEEARRRAEEERRTWQGLRHKAAAAGKRGRLFLPCGLLLWCAAVVVGCQLYMANRGGFYPAWFPWVSPALCGGALLICAILYALIHAKEKRLEGEAAALLARWKVSGPEELSALAEEHAARRGAVAEAAAREKEIWNALANSRVRRDRTQDALLAFVHTFAPEVTNLFGCSAAITRSLSLDHELAPLRERVEERRKRREDLAAQGGRDWDTLELLPTPERSPEETARALAEAARALEEVREELNQARGRQEALGDPAALWARREELSDALSRRRQEHDALSAALSALTEANARLQERFSPELNRLAGEYLARLTGDAWSAVSLNRAMEGSAVRPADVLPRSALSLSRGTADQLYLAVRLAVCRMCLPDKPPLLLDDALLAFDDARLKLALGLLRELAKEQQILLFTCQTREGEALARLKSVTKLTL